jgi:pyruvate/2-oxoglutarate dehydrogenase complex dihydrolipoamide acyltransferase (E2) component
LILSESLEPAKERGMESPNRICGSQEVRGELAYVYALKARAKRHHCLGYGTFPVEMSALERLRKEYSRQVRPITYLPIYVKATALSVQRNPEANAVLFRKPLGLRIVRFERVDVSLPITRQVEGRWVTLVATVRDPASRSLADIQKELAHHERCPPEQSFAVRRMQRFSRMPLWMAQLIHWRMTWSPEFYARNVGTCGLTFVDGNWGEHLFPIAPTSAVFGIGAARREPVVRGEAVAIGRVLHCALMADNYVISGLTGARLARDFQGLLQSGEFIEAELCASASRDRMA